MSVHQSIFFFFFAVERFEIFPFLIIRCFAAFSLSMRAKLLETHSNDNGEPNDDFEEYRPSTPTPPAQNGTPCAPLTVPFQLAADRISTRVNVNYKYIQIIHTFSPTSHSFFKDIKHRPFFSPLCFQGFQQRTVCDSLWLSGTRAVKKGVPPQPALQGRRGVTSAG